jgi:TetR/AcrR family transcriptional regulator, transcriptional repressor for nem operon
MRKTNGHIGDMPRPSLKEQIVVGALHTLHHKGFNGSSVEDITTAAKVPKGSFYNHFKSKEDLALTALDRYWQQVSNGFQTLQDPKVLPLTRLKRYIRHLIKIGQATGFSPGCFIGNMSLEVTDQSPAIREKLAVYLKAWSRAVESCVKEAQMDGSIRKDIDASLIGQFIINSWEGAVMRSRVDRDDSSMATFLRIILKTFAS